MHVNMNQKFHDIQNKYIQKIYNMYYLYITHVSVLLLVYFKKKVLNKPNSMSIYYVVFVDETLLIRSQTLDLSNNSRPFGDK